jgi:rare lipoprotein A
LFSIPRFTRLSNFRLLIRLEETERRIARMWGNISSASKCKSGLRGHTRLAPPIIATLAAASVAGALATSARASTRGEMIVPKIAVAPGVPLKLKAAAINVEPEVATLRAKLDMSGVEQTMRRIALKPRASCINGIASTYNPYKPGDRSGGAETASGDLYDADSWAAAIQIDLRSAFGGVRFGRNYRPAFALVTAGDKSVVVKVNDVGPLLPGRVIDLTERAMRYFDATLERGLLAASVIPLSGENWRAGPLAGGPSLPLAGNFLPETIH